MRHTLTPYDEYPVHTTPYPVSYIPSTDYNWDEGFYYAVMSANEQVFCCTGFRINPNTDMIGGYALINIKGTQRTFRFSRCWRQDYNLRVGPFHVEVVEPLRRIRLVLQENESGISFDVVWEGASPPYLEEHHCAELRGRRTTDQSRYTQPGSARGALRLNGREWNVGSDDWVAVRDHSWGLYVERPPFAPDPKWLPPRPPNPNARALRFWLVFKAGDLSGVYHMHEDAEGVQRKLDDVFGTPFGGALTFGWDGGTIELAAARHEMEFEAGSRLLRRARVILHDKDGREWIQELEAACRPWVIETMGYTPGSWKDGGSFHSYHGSEVLATDWDEFDFSQQPFEYTPYSAAGKEEPDSMRTGLSYRKKIQGVEYLVRIKTIAPDGRIFNGAGQLELFINGSYKPYGFE
jgi:hypothetical protein